MPALGFPSASLPACTPAPASQYPAGDRGLSLYTPQHITALAMIPPAAAHITAAPITPLVYPERPDFTPSHFLLDADDPDPPLEQLHYLQHQYQHDIPGTHPQLWSCLQHIIQQHQRDPDSSSPAVVTSVTSALRSARTAALQLGMDPSAVASDMHLNQPTSLPQLHVALQGPSEATGAPRSAAARPPSGVEAPAAATLLPTWAEDDTNAAAIKGTKCNFIPTRPEIPRGGEPSVYKYFKQHQAQAKAHALPHAFCLQKSQLDWNQGSSRIYCTLDSTCPLGSWDGILFPPDKSVSSFEFQQMDLAGHIVYMQPDATNLKAHLQHYFQQK
jgi:hypothetical protein